MNSIIKADLTETENLYALKKEMVLSGTCPGILPMSVMRGGSSIKGLYNTEGYIRLSELRGMNASMILTIAERSLECIEVCRDYLLFPGEYVLNADTVYISEDFSRSKLTYIPQKKICGENSEIKGFIYSLRPLTSENGRTYLDTLSQMLECKNLRFSRVVGFIEQLKQEIRLCGIE